ncbi:MAG TPA: flavin reductase family protein [Candidatus Hydrogenedentes bacterium]|nr:flavin reductase family protein [Candidatus Hydrogenedentota bacterium]HIJ74963.1 flavin reductase family protein [Candidatus Hydrogenedentota bacterium]
MQIKTTCGEALARKYPEQIAIAIARDPQGKCNPITLGWVMPTSSQPPMLAISVGLTRYSIEAIRHAGSFVISFPSAAMADDALFYGTKSGRDMDKIAACGTKTQEAAAIDCLLFADAVANFECMLDSELLTGDHVIFAGKVIAAHQNEDASIRRLYTIDSNYGMSGCVPA